MTRRDLKTLMYQKGISVQGIANDLNVSAVSVYDILKGVRTSRRIQDHLAKLFDIPFEVIQEAWNNTKTDSTPAPEIVQMQKRICREYNLKHAVNG